MTDERTGARISTALRSVAQTVPEHPPTSWELACTQRAKWGPRPSSGRRTIRVVAVLAACAVLGGAGTGIAAASGAFSTSAEVALGAAMHLLQRTAKWTEPTEMTRLVAPGPGGTTLLVGSASSNSQGGCEALAVKSPGAATPQLVGAACSVSFNSSHPAATTSVPASSYGNTTHGWISPTGTDYAVSFGQAPSETSTVAFITSTGTKLVTGAVSEGWYVIAVPASDLGHGNNVEFFRPTGSSLGTGPAVGTT